MKIFLKKTMALILTALMAFTVIPFAQATVSLEENEMGALKITSVVASSVENDTNVAANTIDGSDTTRWASAQNVKPTWLRFDLGSEQTVAAFSIHWERDNVNHFLLQTADRADAPESEWVKCFEYSGNGETNQMLKLDEVVSSRYFRLYMDDYDGGSNGWVCASLYEFVLYTPVLSTSENSQQIDVTDDFLMRNARASSERYPANGNDGYAVNAFDGTGTWWHTRYSASGNIGSLRDDDNQYGANKIGDTVCDALSDGAIGNRDVWLQTRVSETDTFISGFSYQGRFNGFGFWKDFEVWVSSNEDMSDHVVAYSIEGKKKPLEYKEVDENAERPTQYVYFDMPAYGQYVRFVIKSVYAGTDGPSNSNQYVAADNIEFFELKDDHVESVVEKAKSLYYDKVLNKNDSMQNWSEFFTQESIDAHKNIVDAVTAYEHSNTPDNAGRVFNAFHRYVAPEYCYTVVRALPGLYSTATQLIPDENGKNPTDMNTNTVAYIGGNTSRPRTVTLTADDKYENYDPEFVGWFVNGVNESSTEGSFTYTVPTPTEDHRVNEITIKPVYGAAQLSEENTHPLETNESMLTENAKASSEQYPAKAEDGYAPWAFSETGKWWHSRYSLDNGQSPREDNKFEGSDVLCDDGTVSKGLLDPQNGESVWLQTKVSDTEKLLGGFTYLGRSNRMGMWKEFEVWVSNSEDMEKDGYVLAYTTDRVKDRQLFYQSGTVAEQKCYFDQPVVGKYVRFVIKDVYDSTNGGSGNKHAAVDNITFLEVNEEAYTDVLFETALFNEDIYENVIQWQEFYSKDSLDAYRTAINNVKNASESQSDDDHAAYTLYQNLYNTNTGLEYAYYKVSASIGTNTEFVTIDTDINYGDRTVPNNTDDTYYFGSNVDYAITVKVTATPIEDGLEFDGWFNGDETISSEPNCTITVNKSLELVAKYHNSYNGTINFDTEDDTASTVRKITNTQLLMSNARSNSEEYPEHSNGTDGPATWAFDGNESHWYHSRWSGTGRRPENVFKSTNDDGSVTTTSCDDNAQNYQPGKNQPVWLQTGFDDGDPDTDDSRLIAGFSYISRDGVINSVGDFEIWVSDYEDMDAHGHKVAYTGTFDVNNGSHLIQGEFIPFSGPYMAKYIRLVAYSANAVNISARAFDVYEFVGQSSATVPVTFKFVDETDDNLTFTEDLIKTVNARIQRLADSPEDMLIGKGEFEHIYFDQLADSLDVYNTIAYDFEVQLNTFDPEQHTCNIVVSDAEYSLTAHIGDTVKYASGKYGEVFKQDENAGGGYISAENSALFGYWEKMAENESGVLQGTGEKVYADKDFTLIATENMVIRAVEGAFDGYGVYIPQPVISLMTGTTGDENPPKWHVEIPVTLMNVLDYTGGKRYNIKSNIARFGVVIDKTGTMSTEEIMNSLKNNSTDNLTVSTAYTKETADTHKFNLTNKGRYLHTLNVSQASVATYNGKKIYAYLIDSQNNCYISEGKTLEFKDNV